MTTASYASAQPKTPNPQAGAALTVAASADGALASKSFQFLPSQGAWVETSSYGLGKLFHFRRVYFRDLRGLLNALVTVSPDPLSYIVRGVPIDPANREPQLRRTKERVERDGTITPATIREEPLGWVALDMDSIPPPGVDLTSLTPAQAHAIAVALLPPEFRGVACILQFTAKHGLRMFAGPGQTKDPQVRLRLWFLLDRPLVGAELKAWLHSYPVDPAPLLPHQPVYVSRPEFDGAPDPIPQRWHLIHGGVDRVPVGVIPAMPSKGAPRTGVGVGADVDPDEPWAAGQTTTGLRGWRAIVGQMSDAPGGVYSVCLSATASFLRTEGPDADPVPLFREIERTFRERSIKRPPGYLAEVLDKMHVWHRNAARNDRARRQVRLREVFAPTPNRVAAPPAPLVEIERGIEDRF